jgi:four helix bundle protein
MSRDHRKLHVFVLADELILSVYAETATFPSEERYGLCSQIRRAAVSVPVNIVEGCARRSMKEYLQFLNVATGSTAETLYLLQLSNRLGFLKSETYNRLDAKYTTRIKGLKKLQLSLEYGPRA